WPPVPRTLGRTVRRKRVPSPPPFGPVLCRWHSKRASTHQDMPSRACSSCISFLPPVGLLLTGGKHTRRTAVTCLVRLYARRFPCAILSIRLYLLYLCDLCAPSRISRRTR